jgi:hypothetical protein
MTDPETNERIAVFCGAKWMLFDSGYTWLTFHEAKHGFTSVDAPADPSKVIVSDSVPKYTGSLDAMAEARKSLSAIQRERYARALNEITGAGWVDEPDNLFTVIDATAEQHAEAFLQAIQ